MRKILHVDEQASCLDSAGGEGRGGEFVCGER